jgi:hypothetical protein
MAAYAAMHHFFIAGVDHLPNRKRGFYSPGNFQK